MVNFICQLDWVIRCPHMCSNIILSMSVMVFWGEIIIWISRLSKADCSPQWGGPHPISWRLRQNKNTKNNPSMGKGELLLLDCLELATQTETLVLRSQTCQLLDCNLHHWLSWVSRWLTVHLGTSQSPHKSKFFNIYSLSLLVLFLWRALIQVLYPPQYKNFHDGREHGLPENYTHIHLDPDF